MTQETNIKCLFENGISANFKAITGADISYKEANNIDYASINFSSDVLDIPSMILETRNSFVEEFQGKIAFLEKEGFISKHAFYTNKFSKNISKVDTEKALDAVKAVCEKGITIQEQTISDQLEEYYSKPIHLNELEEDFILATKLATISKLEAKIEVLSNLLANYTGVQEDEAVFSEDSLNDMQDL